MKKYFDRDRLYFLLLLVCLLGSCLFGGAAIMIFDDGRYTFERMKFATLTGAFFPCLLVAVLLFYVLMKKTGRWQMALWVFLLPIVVEGFAYYYFENGYLPSEYLPQDDYRYFRGTPAYDLVHDIVKGKGVEDNAMEAMNYQDTVSGMTPLLFCIRKEYYADAVQLLEKGASPNIVDGKRNTSPLMELCQSRLPDSACSADKQRVLLAL